ncbi:glycosyltransferase family 2 protein [Desulfovibrio litoralis]|uniref:Glycosyltransferase family 92 n=1 Tax=Desulfovibrio litoralis DSM 11393 TaxID=1121455 RepID=A0A1M7T8A0_9BACT|nr:glycosyltransferase family 2 protein [Desulfovibrio litoralis]SHN66955.1 Glycosyltransferase family 92 [Desulfovibrio litoralis DSM 11393]
MHYLGLCCIVKNEDKFLKEWLAYHSSIGVEHFYLYDNESTIPVDTWLPKFADTSKVTILRASGAVMQLPAYNHCLTNFGSKFQWLGFIDADEYLLPHETDDLRTFLAEFEPHGGLGIHWRMFGSSGHEKRPEQPIIKAYTKAFINPDSHIKSIVQPHKTTGCRNPHAFGYICESGCVNEQHLPIADGSAWSVPSIQRIQINHYYFKSREDFMSKLKRGRVEGSFENDLARRMEYFDQHIETPAIEDTRIQRFLPKVEKILKDDCLSLNPDKENLNLSTTELLNKAQTAIQNMDWINAELCMCKLSKELQDVSDLWLMRAMVARSQKRLKAAEFFISEALKHSNNLNIWVEQFQLVMLNEDYNLAEAILHHLKRMSGLNAEEDPTLTYNIDIMEKMLKHKTKA